MAGLAGMYLENLDERIRDGHEIVVIQLQIYCAGHLPLGQQNACSTGKRRKAVGFTSTALHNIECSMNTGIARRKMETQA
jgi:hypothetical protein